MTFNWQKFIKVGDEILEDLNTPALNEAYCRTSINRFYYGVSNPARNFLEKDGRWKQEIEAPKKPKPNEFQDHNEYDVAFKNYEEDLEDFKWAQNSQHGKTIIILKKSENETENTLSSQLSTLFIQRKKADYYLHEEINKFKADLAKLLSNEILNSLKEIGAIT